MSVLSTWHGTLCDNCFQIKPWDWQWTTRSERLYNDFNGSLKLWTLANTLHYPKWTETWDVEIAAGWRSVASHKKTQLVGRCWKELDWTALNQKFPTKNLYTTQVLMNHPLASCGTTCTWPQRRVNQSWRWICKVRSTLNPEIPSGS